MLKLVPQGTVIRNSLLYQPPERRRMIELFEKMVKKNGSLLHYSITPLLLKTTPIMAFWQINTGGRANDSPV
ncbi:hypothetical protein BK004_03210 [bacterium CG10_46_32]|nr:MAG: hypothetical protein BK004_03210 [bacterium CG10_46_32]